MIRNEKIIHLAFLVIQVRITNTIIRIVVLTIKKNERNGNFSRICLLGKREKSEVSLR